MSDSRALTPEDVMQRLSCTRRVATGRITEPRSMTAPIVYFIGHGAEFVKIGSSTRQNLRWRLKMLQVGCPLQLEVVCIEDSAERDYHERFAEHRERGEWFRAAPELLDTMRAIRDRMHSEDWADCNDLSGMYGDDNE